MSLWRVRSTTLSRITKAPCMSHGTLKEARNMSLRVVKTELSVSGTPTWAQRLGPIRRTVTRFSQSQCKSFTSLFQIPPSCVRVRVRFSHSFYSAHDNTKFVSSGGDRSIFLWDVTTGNTIRRISAHLAKINVVEFNADASVVASGKSISVRVADCHKPLCLPLHNYRFL